MTLVAPTALVSPDAELGEGVEIGHCTVVHAGVKLGAGTKIGAFCEIGSPSEDRQPLIIGSGSTIRSHSVIYDGCELGDRLETGHHVLIRRGANVGVNLRIGSYSSLEGELTVGDYGRLQGNVQVGPGSVLGDFVWVFSLVTLTNDPLPPSHVFRPVTLDDGAVVAVGATVMPGAHVGKGAFVAAGARVDQDVPAGAFFGVDGRVAGPVTRLIDLSSGTRHPWMRHFADVFPDDASPRIKALQAEVEEAASSLRRRA